MKQKIFSIIFLLISIPVFSQITYQSLILRKNLEYLKPKSSNVDTSKIHCRCSELLGTKYLNLSSDTLGYIKLDTNYTFGNWFTTGDKKHQLSFRLDTNLVVSELVFIHPKNEKVDEVCDGKNSIQYCLTNTNKLVIIRKFKLDWRKEIILMYIQ